MRNKFFLVIFFLIISVFSISLCFAQEAIVVSNQKDKARAYLKEFCSVSFPLYYPKTYTAIENVMASIPEDVFAALTNRRRPVLFTEYHTVGIGRFANSSEISVLPDDIPAFQEGMTLIKLSTELEGVDEPQAIEGVVAHELAHRFLEHAHKKTERCQREREANRLIQTWGFQEAFQLAKVKFGRKEGEKSGCD